MTWPQLQEELGDRGSSLSAPTGRAPLLFTDLLLLLPAVSSIRHTIYLETDEMLFGNNFGPTLYHKTVDV